MKKVFLLLVLAILFANFSFGQKFGFSEDAEKHPNTKIANVVEKAKPFNRIAGIYDLNKIWPKQIVWVPVEVKKGDTFWSISRNIIYPEVPEYFSVKAEPQLDSSPSEEDLNSKKVTSGPKYLPWWSWFLLIGILFSFIGMGLIIHGMQKKVNGKFSTNPTKEGKPFVEGGIESENEASSHFMNLARRSNPGLNPSKIVIKDKERVYISTPDGDSAVVEFADGTKDNLCFRNVIGWIAMVSINGGKTFKKEAFFNDCGNPVYSRTSMKVNGLILTKEPLVFGDETNQNREVFEKDSVSTEQIAEAKKSIEEKAKTVEAEEQKSSEFTGSESFKMSMKMLEILAGEISKNDIHDLSMKSDPNGSLDVKIVYFDPKIKAQKNDKKTEEKK